MNNEPVAWMYERPNGASKLSFVKEKMLWEDMTEIPLYTHPAKTLTDKPHPKCDEACMYLCKMREITDEEKWKLWGECPNGLVYDRVMMFADLVLRKANEK